MRGAQGGEESEGDHRQPGKVMQVEQKRLRKGTSGPRAPREARWLLNNKHESYESGSVPCGPICS